MKNKNSFLCLTDDHQMDQDWIFAEAALFNFRTHCMLSLLSKDVEFPCACFDVYEKFVASFPPTPAPTQNLKSWFQTFSSQEIGSS